MNRGVFPSGQLTLVPSRGAFERTNHRNARLAPHFLSPSTNNFVHLQRVRTRNQVLGLRPPVVLTTPSYFRGRKQPTVIAERSKESAFCGEAWRSKHRR